LLRSEEFDTACLLEETIGGFIELGVDSRDAREIATWVKYISMYE
jgi:hypothetical protein